MNADLKKSVHEEFGSTNYEKVFSRIYNEYFPMVEKFVLINSGNTFDAKDLFQETSIILFKKLEDDNFKLTARLKTYLMAIAKNLWYKKIRDKKEFAGLEDYTHGFYEDIDLYIEKEKSNFEKLLFLMGKVSKHCNQLINDIFFKTISIDEIQQNYGYTSKHNAQNQKHKCIKQIKNKKIKVYG
ncbi:RNA polymerase sigma factor [Christiangramia echinicola]|uniref:RNA polymerase sigma factor, sigma-70 family n=1 Tax=Christiangramia echinicola TaxID=279359 RepID=A0A1H1SDR4_9FLAO|nr:sigma-70 family RNA polymerase sigma factor [Christiangramia echinicola]SDS45856.1 RNA polymerase sigma factor, sigma-70 family [Christiangramia echinicola]